MTRTRWECWRRWPAGVPSVAPAAPPAAPWAALDQLLEASYGATFQRLDRLAIFDLSTEELRRRLGPFTNPEETKCQP